MADSHGRKAEKSGTDDVISGLPGNLIDSILDRMPIKDAARTSILSRKWRYIWASHPNLVLDYQFYINIYKSIKASHRFVYLINSILMLHCGPILKFNLYIPRFHLTEETVVDNWILFLSRNGIKELTLYNTDVNPYKLPSYIFSCPELTGLTLCYCVLKSPQLGVDFGKLTYLYLKRITFAANPFATAVVNVPLLKFLSFKTCIGIVHFNIHAPKLGVLHVVDIVEVESICFERMPNLTVVRIELHKKLESRLWNNLFSELPSIKLPEIQKFVIDGFFLKFLAAGGTVPRRLPTMFNKLNHIKLANLGFNDVDQISCLLCLIRSSPNLQILEIVKVATNTVTTDAAITITTDALNLSLEYLIAPDCMDQTLDQLLTVRIVLSKDLSIELLFIKLLFACSPSLEKLIIELDGEFDVNEKDRISRELMCFSRASARAEIIGLDSRAH